MEIAIIGGGIVGLALALNLRQRGLTCHVYEAVPEVKELGVGITLLPHAMRELALLGLQEALEPLGIDNAESCFFNRFGQLIYREPRGRLAGYAVPELGMHRGRLHRILYEAALARLGAGTSSPTIASNGSSRTRPGSSAFQADQHRNALPAGQGRHRDRLRRRQFDRARQFYPDERLVFTGINTWRGVTRHAPILTGRSYLRIGSIRTGKIVIYPIIDNVDGEGRQLINWTTEIENKLAGAERLEQARAGRGFHRHLSILAL